ncbi:Ankyrin repeat-containing protein YAR1 [Madurella mycetomatis]|uniref:Ankyrin repeat-containing protein YAR1 n=1 Tax=Madurella mycetomatis TaxID=100816 RepID=A0A175W402_9PEZI|nr:Ankyrin repeat-containing protein YAR1 [Madurella mycetomatis]
MAPKLSEDEIDDLLYAARTGDKDELTTLLSSLAEREKTSPADILANAKDEGKSTCLHMATGNGHIDIVNLLLSHFPDSLPKGSKQAFLDAPNEFGNTGLHWAALGGHLAVVKLLVENGASPALANDKNYVPLDLASFGDKFDVVDYFLAQSGGLESENAEEGMSAEGVKLEDIDGDGDEKEGRDAVQDGEGRGKGKEVEKI